jgi:hypothetical protein
VVAQRRTDGNSCRESLLSRVRTHRLIALYEQSACTMICKWRVCVSGGKRASECRGEKRENGCLYIKGTSTCASLPHLRTIGKRRRVLVTACLCRCCSPKNGQGAAASSASTHFFFSLLTLHSCCHFSYSVMVQCSILYPHSSARRRTKPTQMSSLLHKARG